MTRRIFAPSAGESIRRARIVSVGVTTDNVVEVDIETVVERWSVEVRAGLVGPHLSDAVEQRLRDEMPPGSLRNNLVKPLPSSGNSLWRLQPAGTQVWRVGFALPTAELAQQAFANLQSFGPFVGPGGAGYRTTLFELHAPDGAGYRAEVEVAPPVHSGNPEWVSMNGRSSDSGDAWTGTWTVQASQPGTLRVHRGTSVGQAALGQTAGGGFHSADVRLELKRINARMTEITRSVLGRNSRATTKETVNVPYTTLQGELQRTAQFSAKTARGEAIELCRVNGEPLVAEVATTNAMLTTPAAAQESMEIHSDTNSIESATPEPLSATQHRDGSSTVTYRAPVVVKGVSWVAGLFVVTLFAALVVTALVLIFKGGRARVFGLALLILPLFVAAFIWLGYRKVARDFGPGVGLAPVNAGPRIELTALGALGLPTPPGGMSMLVQSGYRVSVPPGLVATFEVREREHDDLMAVVPPLTAFVATGEKATYSEALWWTLRRRTAGPSTNQLWTWRVSAVGGDGTEIPQRPDHETNRVFHVPEQGKIANEELNWSRLSIPVMVWLSPGQERRIPLFRSDGLPDARGRHPKEIELRIRCARAPELALRPDEHRVELGLAAYRELR